MLTPTSIPEDFPTITTGMGTPLRYFPIRKINRTGNLLFCILFLAGAAGVFLYGAIKTYTAYMQHGAAVIDDTLTTPAIIAFVLFLLGLLAGWGAYSNWRRGVLLYEKGFAIRDRKGVRSWRWEEIASINARITRHYTNGIYTGTTHEYTLLNTKNEKVVVNDVFAKVEELAEAAQENIFPRLYEANAQLYNEGRMILFGPVCLSKSGLEFGKKKLPWEEVKEISLEKGELKIKEMNGGWLSGISITASVIPNLQVLLAILNQVVGVKTG